MASALPDPCGAGWAQEGPSPGSPSPHPRPALPRLSWWLSSPGPLLYGAAPSKDLTGSKRSQFSGAGGGGGRGVGLGHVKVKRLLSDSWEADPRR